MNATVIESKTVEKFETKDKGRILRQYIEHEYPDALRARTYLPKASEHPDEYHATIRFRRRKGFESLPRLATAPQRVWLYKQSSFFFGCGNTKGFRFTFWSFDKEGQQPVPFDLGGLMR